MVLHQCRFARRCRRGRGGLQVRCLVDPSTVAVRNRSLRQLVGDRPGSGDRERDRVCGARRVTSRLDVACIAVGDCEVGQLQAAHRHRVAVRIGECDRAIERRRPCECGTDGIPCGLYGRRVCRGGDAVGRRARHAVRSIVGHRTDLEGVGAGVHSHGRAQRGRRTRSVLGDRQVVPGRPVVGGDLPAGDAGVRRLGPAQRRLLVARHCRGCRRLRRRDRHVEAKIIGAVAVNVCDAEAALQARSGRLRCTAEHPRGGVEAQTGYGAAFKRVRERRIASGSGGRSQGDRGADRPVLVVHGGGPETGGPVAGLGRVLDPVTSTLGVHRLNPHGVLGVVGQPREGMTPGRGVGHVVGGRVVPVRLARRLPLQLVSGHGTSAIVGGSCPGDCDALVPNRQRQRGRQPRNVGKGAALTEGRPSTGSLHVGGPHLHLVAGGRLQPGERVAGVGAGYSGVGPVVVF